MKEQHTLQLLQNDLRDGKISRRTFIGQALALGVALPSATMLAGQAMAATPKKGGTLRMGKGHGQTSDTLDPGLWENGFTIGMGFGLNGYLTQIGADGSLEPVLAESWEGSSDAASWTFRLRQGLEFHDGKSVTANDVVASINHHRGESSTSAAKPLLSAVTDVRAVDARTVKVDLNAGNADFPAILTDYHIPVQPAKDGKMNWQDGIGCGPYKLDGFDPGVSAELSRFSNHWTDEVGHFDKVRMLSLVDPSARTAALVSGDVDAIDKVDLKTAALLARRKGITVHQVTGTQHYTFPMRTDIAPFDNVDLRRAVKHAVNRQELVDKILFGYGEVGNDHPIGSGQRYFNKDLAQTPYDPDKAKHFLKKAGMSSVKLELHTADAAFGGAIDAAVLMKNSASPAGIEIDVKRVPNDGYWSDVWMKKAWCACYWSGRPVEDMMFSTAYEGGASWNDTFWKNDRFDQLLVTARAELDDNKRREMYYEMQAILNDEGGVVIPMFASYVFATTERVGYSDKFASNWDLDGERWMERWWLT